MSLRTPGKHNTGNIILYYIPNVGAPSWPWPGPFRWPWLKPKPKHRVDANTACTTMAPANRKQQRARLRRRRRYCDNIRTTYVYNIQYTIYIHIYMYKSIHGTCKEGFYHYCYVIIFYFSLTYCNNFTCSPPTRPPTRARCTMLSAVHAVYGARDIFRQMRYTLSPNVLYSCVWTRKI